MRLLKGIACLIPAAFVIGMVGVCMAQDASLYSGLKSCKMCHKKEADGNQYGKWVEGPHSKTFEVLASAEAKATAKKLGIDDPQKSDKCLKCHSTAYNWTEKVQTEKIAVEEGVTCESCHGPGKNYKKRSVMRDREASIKAGMVAEPKGQCKKCHNDTAPSWKPDRYTTKDGKKVGFDPVKAYDKIKHPRP